MANHATGQYGASAHSKGGAGRVVALVVLALAICALVVVAVMVIGAQGEARPSTAKEDAIVATSDANLTTAQEEAAYRETHKGRPKIYPLIAQCEDVDLRSPIAPADLTGVLFHQASLKYALVMTTLMPEANSEHVEATGQSRVTRDQVEGEWLDADAMHLWRAADTTEMDTSIDAGATAGTTLRSPVTGTVVLVKDYMLYNEVPDIEIHIQPEGRPDLDVVLIHTYDPLVKAGDKVEAGLTEVSHVRDIAKDLDDVQLAFYTPGDDPGNHVHVQVNDANYENYRATKLEGAITVTN